MLYYENYILYFIGPEHLKVKLILVPKEAQAYSKEVFSETLTPSVSHVGDMPLRETKEGSKSAIIPCFLSN